jgi:hypothetical protein
MVTDEWPSVTASVTDISDTFHVLIRKVTDVTDELYVRATPSRRANLYTASVTTRHERAKS